MHIGKILLVVIMLVAPLLLPVLPAAPAMANVPPGVRDDLGSIENPDWVERYDNESGGEFGLILFMSRMIRLATIIAGIWVLFNITLAAYIFLTKAGSSDAYSKASSAIYMSVVGLVIIIASYTLTGLVGLIVYGDATYILNPVF